jgi:hypothetical protein
MPRRILRSRFLRIPIFRYAYPLLSMSLPRVASSRISSFLQAGLLLRGLSSTQMIVMPPSQKLCFLLPALSTVVQKHSLDQLMLNTLLPFPVDLRPCSPLIFPASGGQLAYRCAVSVKHKYAPSGSCLLSQCSDFFAARDYVRGLDWQYIYRKQHGSGRASSSRFSEAR